VFEEGQFNDFKAYHLAAEGVWQRDLRPSYEDSRRPNQYPPPFAILVAPLGLVPYRAACAAWAIANGVILLLIFARLDRVLWLPLSSLSKMAGFLIVYRVLESDFSNGNANLLVLGSVLLSFGLARRELHFTGGSVLSLAILSKVSPLLILPWAVYRRRWRFFFGALAGLTVFGALMPEIVLGHRGAADSWSAWTSLTVGQLDPRSESYALEPGEGYEPGQSLRAFLHRVLRRSDATAHDAAARSIHVLDLPKMVVDGLYLGLALSILALLLLAAWRRAKGARLSFRPEEIAAACAAMVLLAPLSRKAHFVALWPAAVLGFDAWRKSETVKLRRVGALLWFLALVLVAGTTPALLGRPLSTRVLAYCPLSWAAALLLVLVSDRRFFPRGGLTALQLTPACPVPGRDLGPLIGTIARSGPSTAGRGKP
jgi:hypothetical protein